MANFSSSVNYTHGYPSPGPQTPDAQKVLDHVFFLSETEWKTTREEELFDYIILGSGFCGYAFAERILKKDPSKRILLLERGTYFLPEHFQNLAIPYQQTLGGLSETFPWTLARRTALQPAGKLSWQHGMVPFFGGRSIMWSAWCPRPTDEEMEFWPKETIEAAKQHFASAEELLNVTPADEIDMGLDPKVLAYIAKERPVYGLMQKELQELLKKNISRIPSATRWMPAPLAAGAGKEEGIDFAKFSVPSKLLELVDKQAKLSAVKKGSALKLLANCVVKRILSQDGVATALDTTRGVVNIGEAKLILAMGTIPPATLVMNSFPNVQKAGKRFTSHFITSIVARVPRKDFKFGSQLAELELAAIYMAGENKTSKMQYHVQLSVLSDKKPEKNAQKAARYMPDVVATASMAQLLSSKDHLVFVCAVLGEQDWRNPDNHLKLNGGSDPTTNVTLQSLTNAVDDATWDTMDKGTFDMLEQAFAPVPGNLEYWHGSPTQGSWQKAKPSIVERRVSGTVHEGSTMWIGKGDEGVVGLDYRVNGVQNVYVTGGSLWPASGSWNPTMTMVALAQDLADQLAKASSK